MASVLARRAAALRDFNRFYTNKIGVLDQRLLGSKFSLTAARVLYEIAHSDGCTASDLIASLTIDRGYVSRIVSGFVSDRLVRKVRSETDGRVHHLHLTAAGKRAFSTLNRKSQDQAESHVGDLDAVDQATLINSLHTVQSLLGGSVDTRPIRLRRHRPGDIGWVVYRHGVLYAREYKWDEDFEALVARILADFVRDLDPERERAFIADRGGERLGSVFVTKKTANVALLRLLLVEPGARGHGLGRRLVRACIDFARDAGYQTLSLWTNHPLVAARGIYAGEGFVKVREEPHESFGHSLVGETWERSLR